MSKYRGMFERTGENYDVHAAIAEITGTSDEPIDSPKGAYAETFKYKVIEFAHTEQQNDAISVPLSRLKSFGGARQLMKAGWVAASFKAEQLNLTNDGIEEFAKKFDRSPEDARAELIEYCGVSTVFNVVKPAIVIKPTISLGSLAGQARKAVGDEIKSAKKGIDLGYDQETGYLHGPAVVVRDRSSQADLESAIFVHSAAEDEFGSGDFDHDAPFVHVVNHRSILTPKEIRAINVLSGNIAVAAKDFLGSSAAELVLP